MAEAQKLDRQQTYMLHVLNWMEVASGLQATIINADFEIGAVKVFGKDSKKFRGRLKEMMRRFK